MPPIYNTAEFPYSIKLKLLYNQMVNKKFDDNIGNIPFLDNTCCNGYFNNIYNKLWDNWIINRVGILCSDSNIFIYSVHVKNINNSHTLLDYMIFNKDTYVFEPVNFKKVIFFPFLSKGYKMNKFIMTLVHRLFETYYHFDVFTLNKKTPVTKCTTFFDMTKICLDDHETCKPIPINNSVACDEEWSEHLFYFKINDNLYVVFSYYISTYWFNPLKKNIKFHSIIKNIEDFMIYAMTITNIDDIKFDKYIANIENVDKKEYLIFTGPIGSIFEHLVDGKLKNRNVHYIYFSTCQLATCQTLVSPFINFDSYCFSLVRFN